MVTVSAQAGSQMGRRIYQNPPVHEIVLDLQFAEEAPLPSVEAFPNIVGTEFGTPAPVSRISTHSLVGSIRSSVTSRPPKQEFWGWDLVDRDRRRVSTVTADQLTQHFLRSDGWPEGPYSGWESSAEPFLKLLEAAAHLFENLVVRRAGLRYVNRIAVPRESDLETWFRVVPAPLESLNGLWELSVSRTWKEAPGFPGLSGTVSIMLTQDDLAEEDLQSRSDLEEVAVTLDIDVFNFWVNKAPQLSEVPEWIERAHRLEHTIFRSCITPALEERFGILEDLEDT